jgi:four helix bundle protein
VTSVGGVRRYQDLECWKLANEFKCRVYDLVETSSARKDLRFRDQLIDAASSGPSNIAEGFACYRHKEGARYARIAKASLTEASNHLSDGIDRRHWTAEHVAPLMILDDRAIRATVGWVRHLETTEAPPAHWEIKRTRPTRKRR